MEYPVTQPGPVCVEHLKRVTELVQPFRQVLDVLISPHLQYEGLSVEGDTDEAAVDLGDLGLDPELLLLGDSQAGRVVVAVVVVGGGIGVVVGRGRGRVGGVHGFVEVETGGR